MGPRHRANSDHCLRRARFAVPPLAAGFHAISATTNGCRGLIQGRSWPTRPSLSGLRRYVEKPDSLTADSAYGSAESLAWLVKQNGIAAHSCLRQVQPNRRHLLPRRLRLRRRTRSLDVPRGQRACPIPTHLRHSQKWRHSRGHKTLSRQQIGLRRLQIQSPVLPERSCPQDPAGSARRRPRRGPVRMPPLQNTWRPVTGGRKSRCCLPISSKSCASRAYA